MTNQFLENEKLALEDKLVKARDGSNENTYKNLIQAYERVLELIRKENVWTDMYSHYKMKIDDEFQEVVSTWKQKGEDIKDHKTNKEIGEIYKCIYENTMRSETLIELEKIMYVSFDIKNGFHEILKYISDLWNHISKDDREKVNLLMGGMRYQYYVPSMIESLSQVDKI